MKAPRHPVLLCLLALLPLWSCANPDYDLSKGVDREVTLFSDEVGVPLGDIAPITLRAFLDMAGIGSALTMFAREDEDGYLVIEEDNSFYSNFAILLSYSMLDPTAPGTVAVDDNEDTPGSTAASMAAFGFAMSPQSFCLYAENPLTEEIAVSGKVTLSSMELEDAPAETLVSEEYSEVKVPAGAQQEVFFRVERSGGKTFYASKLENMKLHLPASMLAKDPNGGMGVFALGYRYRGFAQLASDFPTPIPIDVDDLSLPLAAYRVKEARIRAEVSNEIPMTLEIGSLKALVRQTDEEGNTTLVPAEGVSVSADVSVASGTYGNPVVSPVELVIEAQENTIPDIDGLQLEIAIKAPTGEGDRRMNMNETIAFNNIRTTISGGITLQGNE